ncbi:hypothetical protein COCVIDRAFT_16371 [Bipolaris victoriae FI3]|uniref:Beta-lactamase-related domain-containing protein n=1 Tax=Bipolaris victoriae (strain FI3) TaxID=930091 RepID=W7EKU7_BIPV3|nr:hypothetical protein COCVIDRAFT_16371 [Bipolaris victoriae FI3]
MDSLSNLLNRGTNTTCPDYVAPYIAGVVVGRSALQMVEKGLIGLDDDVTEILLDLASLEVLDGGEPIDGIPTTKPRKTKITLRLNTTLDSTQISMKKCPLAFEPGSSWSYGAGIDWAGELPQAFPVPLEPEREIAGHEIWGTMSNYAKLLGALLDGGSLVLGQELVDEIFTPQETNTNALNSTIQGPYKPALGPLIPASETVHHGLAGLINVSDFPGRRKSGTLQWSGMPNLFWGLI